MSVKWIELSPKKRKALRIVLIEHESGIQGVASSIGMSRSTIFNKLNGKCKFKEKEYREILDILGITDEELEECSKSYILKFIKEGTNKND